MTETSNQQTDTKTRILDAAEELFSEQGFRNVSLRQITQVAEVNLASVNYHFGSREALVDEVLARVIGPVNEKRLLLLTRAEENATGPLSIETVLDCFHRPVVDQLGDSSHQSNVYLKLAGRCFAEPDGNISSNLIELFQEVITRFMKAAGAALPHLEQEDVFWRLHFSVGTMIFALTHEDRVEKFSGGNVSASSPEDTLKRLIDFTASGMKAPPTQAPERPVKKSLKVARAVSAAIALLALSSCQSLTPPDAKGHASLKAPSHWIAGNSYRPAHLPDRNWVENFSSPDLTTFIDSVLENNRSLKAAQSRIEIAGANARIVGADLYPQIQGGFSNGRSLQNFVGLPLPGAPPGTILSSRTNQFGLSLDLSWELDLWGRIKAAKSASVADFEASVFDRSTAELSLAGQSAKAWFALAEARDQVQLSRSAIATFSNTENSIRDRFELGLDEQGQSITAQLLLAEADVSTARDRLASRQELVGRTSRQLEVLAGRYPAGQAGKSARLPSFPSRVPADLPATLLDRRPDLAAAERRIAASDKRLLEAKRSLMPRISLTSGFGTSSDDISDILDSDFTIWSLASNAVQPLLQGGRLRANISKRDSELQLAAAEFEQSALTAFSEVENALAAEAFLGTRTDAIARTADLSKRAYQRSLEEFSNGTGDLLTVLTSQQRLFTSRSQLLTVRRLRLDNRVDLYLALGGSFRPYSPPPEKEPQT